MSVRLLTGYFEDVDSYAIQDCEGFPLGTVDETQFGLGVIENGSVTWGDAHLDDL